MPMSLQKSLRKMLVGLASAWALSGCVLATPFEGPGYSKGAGPASDLEGPLIASVTYTLIRDTGNNRDIFFDYVEKLESALAEQPGLVGFSRRADFLGNEAWTLSVWRDQESLLAFVNGPGHRRAVKEAWNTFENAKFARLEIHPDELPLQWDRALAALETDGRHYYE